jgi:hypothetical protein
VVFTSPDTDCGALADALEQAIARSLAVRPAVVVLSDARCQARNAWLVWAVHLDADLPRQELRTYRKDGRSSTR